MEAMARLVRRATITMPFLSSDALYGTPISGDREAGGQWHHFAIKPPAERIYRGTALKNAFQAACEKREEMSSVVTALAEYSADTCKTALQLLKDDQLGNSEAVLGQAQFLVGLHEIRDGARRDRSGDARRNLTWRAVAQAPSGFCHPRSSMIATLLDDIQAGRSFEQARAAWNRKMHPLSYQRPQAAPTAGAIAAAEKAFAALGAATALERRFATMDDIAEKLWQPKAARATAPTGGIFASVQAKGEAPPPMSMRAPAVTMTWEKFARTVLPTAEAIELFAGHSAQPFVALTTAVHADARPILQWDNEERRNPVAWYLYNGGSYPSTFNLEAGHFHRVTAITAKPPQWFGGEFPHQGEAVILLLQGAKDTRGSSSAAIFPSTLKSEYRPYSSTIEAFSNKNRVQDAGGEHVAGLMLPKGDRLDALVRVTSGGRTSEYRIDRWD
jgi:hypothetical protein